MKTRVWIPAATLLVLAMTALLAHAASSGSFRAAGAKAAIAKQPGTVSAPADLFASKRRPVTAAGAKRNSAFADPIERARISRRIAAGWRAFHERRAAAGGVAPERSTAKAAFDAFAAKCGTGLDAHWDMETGLPIFMMGTSGASATESAPRASAIRFLDENRALFKLDDPVREFVFTRASIDRAGVSHLRYQQYYRGLEIWGSDLVVHVGADGRVTGVNGRASETPRSIGDATPGIDAGRAIAAAAGSLGRADLPPAEAPRLLIAPDETGALRLAWLVHAEIGLIDRWLVFVDAKSGEEFRRVSLVASDGPVTGSALDLSSTSRTLNLYQVGPIYYMIDASKEMWDTGLSTPPETITGGIRVLDARHGDEQNLWFVTASSANGWSSFRNGVSASFFVSKIYDYYRQKFGRNSINGDGGTIETILNYGQSLNNAYWTGSFMVFGNGDNQIFSDLAGALDVAGHEMTHGVIEHTANLVYEFQPGALNESMADVFGACVESFGLGAGAGDWWLLAEDVTTPGTPGDCLRNMQNPALGYSPQPTKMSEYQNLTSSQDHGGVHVNSGIPNRAAFLIGQSLGLGKLEQIYYKALGDYMTRSSQFIDARLAVIQAAKDLYGNTSAEAAACANAFDTVEIFDDTGSTPPEDRPPVEGAEWIALKQRFDSHLYRAHPDFTQADEITSIEVFSRPAFADNGATMLFVDGDHDLWIAGSDGSDPTQLSQGGGWWSVAVSPNGARIALTSDVADSSIYVLDLAAELTTRYYLECVTYDGTEPTYPDYADQLSFSLDSEYLLFDAFYSTGLGQSGIQSWDIDRLRLSDGVAFRVFPIQPAGVQIGNPVFASNNDSRIAFDYIGVDGQVTVYGADLDAGTLGVITTNGTSPGRPSFSTDDRTVVYHYISPQDQTTIWTVSLEADGITGIPATDHGRLEGGFDPVWFAVGHRSDVALAYFEAEMKGPACEVRWGAFSEENHAGYNLYRCDGAAPKLIARMLRDPVSRGAVIAYRYVDRAPGGAPASYLLEAVDRRGSVQRFGPVTASVVNLPVTAALVAAPNPFTRQTIFTVTAPGRATLRIFDARGRLVRELLNGAELGSPRTITWEGTDLHGRAAPAGVYFARLECSAGARAQRIVKLP